VQISLPGYSQYFSRQELFNRDAVWRSIVRLVQKLRQQVSIPVVVMPGMYEAFCSAAESNQPEVIGIVKNSPAFQAGIRQGDIIQSIEGLKIRNRPQARDVLSMFQQSSRRYVSLTVERQGQIVSAALDLERFYYPYSKMGDTHLGLVFTGTGLRNGDLEKLKEIIDRYQAKNVLFLSSTLVKPAFEQLLHESVLFAGRHVQIDIIIPENESFGGNIFMGDLLLVEDFILSIKKYVREQQWQPDLVVIPSSPFQLSGWGRDLSARCYLDIERAVGIPVELLPCQTIYD
jgi:membrane-associated protease RseP (regulator of RpoE activity)